MIQITKMQMKKINDCKMIFPCGTVLIYFETYFVDATLTCEDKQIKAHKVIISVLKTILGKHLLSLVQMKLDCHVGVMF